MLHENVAILPGEIWAHIFYMGIREDPVARAQFRAVCRDFRRIRTYYWECSWCSGPSFDTLPLYLYDHRGTRQDDRGPSMLCGPCARNDPMMPRICDLCHRKLLSTSATECVYLNCVSCQAFIVSVGTTN